MNFKLNYSFLAVTAIFFSCTSNNNQNIALESPSHPDHYSKSLVSALSENDSDNEFIIKDYKERGINKYVIVEVSGEHVHAEIPLLLTEVNKLAQFIDAKGVSYHGAELTGLQLSLVNDPIAKYQIDQVESIVD
ncbi:MAG: hypothetical protein V4687_14935 [Bacteroidota bacterium]